MLVVRLGREADQPPPFRELRGVEGLGLRVVEKRVPALRVEETTQAAQDGLGLRWQKGNESGSVLPPENKCQVDGHCPASG